MKTPKEILLNLAIHQQKKNLHPPMESPEMQYKLNRIVADLILDIKMKDA